MEIENLPQTVLSLLLNLEAEVYFFFLKKAWIWAGIKIAAEIKGNTCWYTKWRKAILAPYKLNRKFIFNIIS